MSRYCGSTETVDGRPCQNLVDDFGDHCSAGHHCAVIGLVISSGAPSAPGDSGAPFEYESLAGINEVGDEWGELFACDHDPSTADAWRAAFPEFHVGLSWYTNGWAPDVASAWKSAGFGPFDYEWKDAAGEDNAALAARWVRIPTVTPRQVTLFAEVGLGPEEFLRLKASGSDPELEARRRYSDSAVGA
jgi:hypothetical protein